jgi:hypothetical protein
MISKGGPGRKGIGIAAGNVIKVEFLGQLFKPVILSQRLHDLKEGVRSNYVIALVKAKGLESLFSCLLSDEAGLGEKAALEGMPRPVQVIICLVAANQDIYSSVFFSRTLEKAPVFIP